MAQHGGNRGARCSPTCCRGAKAVPRVCRRDPVSLARAEMRLPGLGKLGRRRHRRPCEHRLALAMVCTPRAGRPRPAPTDAGCSPLRAVRRSWRASSRLPPRQRSPPRRAGARERQQATALRRAGLARLFGGCQRCASARVVSMGGTRCALIGRPFDARRPGYLAQALPDAKLNIPPSKPTVRAAVPRPATLRRATTLGLALIVAPPWSCRVCTPARNRRTSAA